VGYAHAKPEHIDEWKRQVPGAITGDPRTDKVNWIRWIAPVCFAQAVRSER